MAPCGDVAGAVASMLCALGFAGVFCAPPSAGFCAEPIVVTQGAFARARRVRAVAVGVHLDLHGGEACWVTGMDAGAVTAVARIL